MRAAIFHAPGDMEVRDAPEPTARDGDVLLRVIACGICGSDTRALATPPTMHYTPEIIFGHELVGEVVSGAERGLAAVFPSIPCGTCRQCLEGRGNLCTAIRHIGATITPPLKPRRGVIHRPNVDAPSPSAWFCSASHAITVPPPWGTQSAHSRQPLAPGSPTTTAPPTGEPGPSSRVVAEPSTFEPARAHTVGE